tara:strand:- start:327 stop:1022 length:696 start_codon:yes stop_codon:yes gene_type:complete
MNKSNSVKRLFDDLSSQYDFLNDLFSFGLHRVWKKQLLDYLEPLSGERWVDLCCGTGDLAISLAKLVSPEGVVYGIDSAEKTLYLAKERCSSKPWLLIEWVNRDIFDVDNKYEYFDGAVMSYGLRNLSDPYLGFKKIRSFLKKGGRAGILDFNRNNENSIGDFFQKTYLKRLVIPFAGYFGFEEHFTYLKDSIEHFPDSKAQENLAIKAGFTKAEHHVIAGGQMGILILHN